jgi:hypothetical protein
MKFNLLGLKLPTAPPAPIPEPSALQLAERAVEASRAVLLDINKRYKEMQDQYGLAADSLGRITFCAAPDFPARDQLQIKLRYLVRDQWRAQQDFYQRLREFAGVKEANATSD